MRWKSRDTCGMWWSKWHYIIIKLSITILYRQKGNRECKEKRDAEIDDREKNDKTEIKEEEFCFKLFKTMI